MTRFEKLIAVLVGAVLACAVGYGFGVDLTRSEWAAWVQAGGSIVVIVAASFVASYQLRLSQEMTLGGHPRKPENLWLQPWDGEWSARVKDRLEAKLKALVYRGALSLERARRAIAVDWIGAFKSYVTGDASVEVLSRFAHL